MSSYRICDTNVFRNIGADDLNADGVRGDGATICYSPVSVLELASRYTDESFEHRKAAAQAILDCCAERVPDPETYLTRDVFGLGLNEKEFDWAHAVHAMAQSASMEELQQGVADFNAGVRRRVNLTLARSYRDGIDRDFVQDMLIMQEREIPGFSDWWNPDPLQRVGQVPRLAGHDRDHFLQQTQLPHFRAAIIEACRDRALFKTNDRPPWPPTKQWVKKLVEAFRKLEFYSAIYTQYLIRLLTAGMLPRVNDWWDLEIMIYCCNDDHVVVTSERKWRSLATDAGFGQRIIRVL